MDFLFAFTTTLWGSHYIVRFNVSVMFIKFIVNFLALVLWVQHFNTVSLSLELKTRFHLECDVLLNVFFNECLYVIYIGMVLHLFHLRYLLIVYSNLLTLISFNFISSEKQNLVVKVLIARHLSYSSVMRLYGRNRGGQK